MRPFFYPPLITCVMACLLITGCRNEQKHLRGLPQGGTLVQGAVQSELQAGPFMHVSRTPNPFEGNVHAIAEGKKLFGQFNCAGCHANGGGAIGPALMDDEWIYGSTAETIFAVIVEGRPQGMPTYGTRIPEYQLWQIVAYVRSMSDLSRDSEASQFKGEVRNK